MNIDKIFSALEQNQMNSALGVICAELESQGYKVEIEGIQVTSSEIFENKLPSLEEAAIPLNINLFKNGKEEQKFSIEFIDFHKLVFKDYMTERSRYDQ